MKILVFGATGSTGRCLIEEAQRRGHEVTAFVRDPSRLAEPATPHIQGDITDPEAVRRAMVGQDTVLSALGPRALKRDPELVEGIRTIVSVMQEASVRRLVYVSSMGVGESRRQLSWLGRHVAVPLFLRNAIADHAEKESIITNSSLEWTIVRPAQLMNGPVGSYRSGEDISATTSSTGVSRASVASFILDLLEGTDHVRAKPNIMG